METFLRMSSSCASLPSIGMPRISPHFLRGCLFIVGGRLIDSWLVSVFIAVEIVTRRGGFLHFAAQHLRSKLRLSLAVTHRALKSPPRVSVSASRPQRSDPLITVCCWLAFTSVRARGIHMATSSSPEPKECHMPLVVGPRVTLFLSGAHDHLCSARVCYRK